ncbi:ABC transporter ATP-binding protein [Calycomorphotria hydatis]|uniref:ABC transporter ATP-binding protein n=1 Tax=Calycomorphotria hydatis TaxID=2528027 RepID=UPI0018D240BD|nr:ABC transporter ATP-binding protein [Calycomorphotria hydatis]
MTIEFRENERVGVIGGNGSGKSTLLKMLSGIYPPTSGRIETDGEVSALFDFSLGFEADATGRENIYFRGYLQGESTQEIAAKFDEIVEFSELTEFIDIPVRCYSAGMLVRLGFAISTLMRPDILLVDECLAAGDANFMSKAKTRMQEMINEAQLLIIVSHDMETIAELCDRVIWMEKGILKMDGSPDHVIRTYQNRPLCNAA